MLRNIPTSSEHLTHPRCRCARHCHLGAQRKEKSMLQAKFHCLERVATHTHTRAHACMVPYNMCAPHLECKLTVISVAEHTVSRAQPLIWIRTWRSGFLLYIRGVLTLLPPSGVAACIKVDGLRLEQQGRHVCVSICHCSSHVRWSNVVHDGQPREPAYMVFVQNKSGGCLYVWLSFLCIVKRVPFTSDVGAGNDVTSELTAFQLHVGNKSEKQLSVVAVDHNKLHRYWCTKWTQSQIKVAQYCWYDRFNYTKQD